MTDPAFRHQRRAIYAAQRLAGRPVLLCRASNISLNASTGEQTNSLVQVKVRKALVLPASSLRSFLYGRPEISSGRSFVYGGFFDAASQVVLVSRRDIPNTFTLDQNAYLVIDGRRLEIKQPSVFEEFVIFEMTGLERAVDEVNESVGDNFNVTDAAQ